MNDPSEPLHEPKHEAFARLVADRETKTRAYVLAGYKTKNAGHGGSMLSRRPEVAARIEYLKRKISDEAAQHVIETRKQQEQNRAQTALTLGPEIIRVLTTEMNGSGPDTHSSARVAAAMNLAKLLGITADAVEHSGGMQIEVIYADQQPTNPTET